MTGADSLSARTARAARWRLGASIAGALCQFAVGVLLARLLTPGDFGVVVLATIALGLAQPLADLGVGNAVVQRAALTDRHVRAAFAFSVAAGVSVAALVSALAPIAASLLGQPEAAPVLRVLSAALAIRGAGIVSEALLRRALDFRRLFYVSTGSYVLGYGVVAAILALRGYGMWSLVWGHLAQTSIAAAAQIIATRHPVRPLFARRELAELLTFGLGASLSGWVNYLAVNGDNVVVGRAMGAGSLGLYDRAYSLMNMPTVYVAGVMSGVLFPAMSLVQDDRARLRRAYLLATGVTATIAGPAMVTLAIAAPHLLPAVYGRQWAGAVLPLQILCAAGYFRALYHLGGAVAQSVGRVYGELWRQILYAGLVIGGALAARPYGLAGVAVAVDAAILVMFVASGDLALRATGAGWRAYADVQRRAAATTLATAAAAVGARLAAESLPASNVAAALAILGAAAVPWTIGLRRTLEAPEMSALRGGTPD